MEQIEKISTQETIEEFADLRGLDLSSRDLSSVSVDILVKVEFDTKTIWPEQEKLPEGFNPEKILEQAKDPGLGIRELHAQGIDGRGVTVAIIDQTLSPELGDWIRHKEYATNIVDYKEFGTAYQESVSMHGPAAASLLVGKECGVAPGAKLVYRATSSGRNFNHHADALFDIIEFNKKAAPEEKVRIVSCSYGFRENGEEEGIQRWVEAIKKAEEEGIVVSDVGERTGVEYIGGGTTQSKDNIDNYNIALFLGEEEKIVSDLFSETQDLNVVVEKVRELLPEKTSGVSDEVLKDKLQESLSYREREMIIPSDYRTMASQTGANEYMYNGNGGMSWAVPYLSGLFALAWQVNPNFSKQEIVDAINTTVLTNKNKLKVVNPKGFIEYLQNKK